MSDVLFTIRGLRCNHCVQTVTAAIEAVPGVRVKSIDLATGHAWLELDTGPESSTRIETAIKQAGFEVEHGHSARSDMGQTPPPDSTPQPIALPIAGLESAAGQRRAETEKVSASTPDTSTNLLSVLFDVTGMHCASCTARAEGALGRLAGVREAHANLAMNQVSVRYDPTKLTDSSVLAEIKHAGYTAQLAPPPEKAAQDMERRQREAAEGWKQRLILSVGLLAPLVLVDWLMPAGWRTAGG